MELRNLFRAYFINYKFINFGRHMENEVIFDETEGEQPEAEEVELDFKEWLKLDLNKRIGSYSELSLADQHKAFPLIPAKDKERLMDSYEKKLFESIKNQKYLPGTIAVDYVKTSEYSFQSLVQGNNIVSKGLGKERAKIIKSSRSTGGSSISYNFYSNSSNKTKGNKAYKCVIHFYPDHAITGNSSRLLDYIFSENKKQFKPSLSRDSCKVACSCNDYFYSYSEINWSKGAKAGKRPQAKAANLHSRNKPQLAGVCKHLLACADFLKTYGLASD